MVALGAAGCLAGACASGAATEGDLGPEDRGLRLAPERVFDAERPFMRGNPVGLELHWWLSRDSEAAVARALAPYDTPVDFIPAATAERLRLSGLRVIAVPLSEVFVVHQVAPPAPGSGWSRRWLGQAPDWVQLVRSRSVAAGTRTTVYGSEQQLTGGILRLLGCGWMQPHSVEREGERRIEAVMHIEIAAQIQRVRDEEDRSNPFLRPSLDVLTPLSDEGPLIEDALLSLTVPRGYALVLTTESPDADWSEVEGVTRDTLEEELERREAGAPDEPDEAETDEQSGPSERFGPSPAPPSDVEEEPADESVQVFDTLDAPMPSLSDAYGPPAAPVPTIGQLLLETRDSLSRPMRAVIILIPRLPERFEMLP